QQVVLAEAVEVDVLHDHHLVVGDREERIVQDRHRVLLVALREEAQRARDARRRPREPFAAGLLAELLQELRDARLDRVRDLGGLAHAGSPSSKELRRVSTMRTRRRRAAPSAAIGAASSSKTTRAMFSAVGTRPRAAKSGASLSRRWASRLATCASKSASRRAGS